MIHNNILLREVYFFWQELPPVDFLTILPKYFDIAKICKVKLTEFYKVFGQKLTFIGPIT